MNNQVDKSINQMTVNEIIQQSSLTNQPNHLSSSTVNSKLVTNSSISLNSNQPNCFWNLDSGIQTQTNSCIDRDEMDALCNSSQNSNLDEITTNLSNNVLIDEQINYPQEFNKLTIKSLETNLDANNQNLPFEHLNNIPQDTNGTKNFNLNSSQNINSIRSNIVSKNNQPNNQLTNHLNNDFYNKFTNPSNNCSTNRPFNQINNNLINRPQTNFVRTSSVSSNSTNNQSFKIKTEPKASFQNQQTHSTKNSVHDIKNLIDLLNDHDQLVVLEAVKVVYYLLQNDKNPKIVLNSNELVESVVHLANISTDNEILKYTAAIFHNFSLFRPGLKVIFQNNVLPVLYKLLETNEEIIVYFSITTLHNLVLKNQYAKDAVLMTGIPILIRLLSKDNCKFLAIVTDCLHMFAFGYQECKQMILDGGGPQELIRIIGTYTNYPKLLWTTTRVLKVLSVCPKNKQAIIQFGGMQVLAKNILFNNPKYFKIVLNSLWTLRNLSDAAINQNNLGELLEKLVLLLNHEDLSVVTCTAGILANLTCNNQLNKQIVCNANGLNVLLQTLIRAGDMQEILEPTLRALRHLTTRHQNAEFCQNSIRLACGLQPIVKLLQPPSKWPVVKACVNLIRNLALCAENSQPLREKGVIQRLFHLLFKADQEIKRTCATFTFTFENVTNCSVDDIKMYEIIESTLGSLQVLAKDPLNCEIIIGLNFISLCIEIIYNYQLESIQKVALGCLDELAKLPSGKELFRL